MYLAKRHPEVAAMNCAWCQKYVTTDNWQFERGRDGKPVERLVQIGNEFAAPCRDPNRGCPKGTPEHPKSLSEDNKICYEHYRECRAVNQFPDDPIVRRNAAIIQAAEQRAIEEMESDRDNAAFEAIRNIADV